MNLFIDINAISCKKNVIFWSLAVESRSDLLKQQTEGHETDAGLPQHVVEKSIMWDEQLWDNNSLILTVTEWVGFNVPITTL